MLFVVTALRYRLLVVMIAVIVEQELRSKQSSNQTEQNWASSTEGPDKVHHLQI